MVCFCKTTASQLGLLLPSLNVSASLDLDADVQLVANWLAGLGLPAPPWAFDLSWLQLQLPTIALSASAIATISAAASLRAQVMAQLGIDLLIPGQANAFARLVATLTARLEASVGIGVGLGVWPALAAQLSAIARVEAALSMGLFVSMPSFNLGMWQPFLIQLRAILPMISLSAQLGLDLSENFAADLSAMISAIVRIQMPQVSIGTMSFMASLSASLNAIAQLRLSLGVDPLQVGLPTIQAMISARLRVLARLCLSVMGMNLSGLLALLPSLQVTINPGFATAASISAVMSLNASALASLNWSVPVAASLPVLTIGLPALTLSAQLSAAFGLSASLSPCGAICDAGAIMSASAGLMGGIV